MYSTFPAPTSSHSDELDFFLTVLNVPATNITKPTPDALLELDQNVLEWSCIRNVSLDSFRSEFLDVGFRFSGTFVFGNRSTQTSHPSENFHKFSVFVQNLIRIKNTLLGDSSQPPTNRPSIMQSAPAANALHIFPL